MRLQRIKPFIWGFRTRWEGRGLTLPSYGRRREALTQAAGRQGLPEPPKPPGTHKCLPLKNPAGKADEQRPTDSPTGRAPPRGSLTRHLAGAAARVEAASGGLLARAVPGALGAGAAPGAGWRPGGREQRAVQRQGQRRRLLASARLSLGAAVGGQGVLRPLSGPLLPPPSPLRLPRPRARLAGSRPAPAGWVPQVAGEGRSAPARAPCGPLVSTRRRGHAVSSAGAGWEQGWGGAGRRAWAGRPPPSRPPPKHSPGSCRLPSRNETPKYRKT